MRVRTRSIRTAGFRRCGVRHTAEPQEWPAGQFTAEQVELMQADPDLVVEVLDAAAVTSDTPDSGLEQRTVAELREMVTARGIDPETIEGTGRGGAVVKADLVRVLQAPVEAGAEENGAKDGDAGGEE